MTKDGRKTEDRPKKRGGNLIPALCSALGSLILAAVILSALPLSVPRLFGYSIYSVVSGSMEPALPVGSIVYVEPAGFTEIRIGDIIAFDDEGTVVTHRVIEDRPQESAFITKGDANSSPDILPTPYWKLIGRVKLCLPLLGRLMPLYAVRNGKIVLAFFAVSGLLFRMIGSRMREYDALVEKRKSASEREGEKKE